MERCVEGLRKLRHSDTEELERQLAQGEPPAEVQQAIIEMIEEEAALYQSLDLILDWLDKLPEPEQSELKQRLVSESDTIGVFDSILAALEGEADRLEEAAETGQPGGARRLATALGWDDPRKHQANEAAILRGRAELWRRAYQDSDLRFDTLRLDHISLGEELGRRLAERKGEMQASSETSREASQRRKQVRAQLRAELQVARDEFQEKRRQTPIGERGPLYAWQQEREAEIRSRFNSHDEDRFTFKDALRDNRCLGEVIQDQRLLSRNPYKMLRREVKRRYKEATAASEELKSRLGSAAESRTG